MSRHLETPLSNFQDFSVKMPKSVLRLEHDLIVRNSYRGPYISQFLGEIQGVLVIHGLLEELKNHKFQNREFQGMAIRQVCQYKILS